MKLPVNYDSLSWKARRLAREQYIKEQGGNCAWCKGPLSEEASKEAKRLWINSKLFPTGFFDHPVHLHHDHDTGMTIGAVHNTCNAILWQYHGK